MNVYPNERKSYVKTLAITLLILIYLIFLYPPGEVFAKGAATNRYVATTGVDIGNCSNSASPCMTVAYAVGQSAGGDTINIANGTYPNTHVTVNIPLNFIGGGMKTTILDGGGPALLGRVFTVNAPTTILDMKIQNGVEATNGGGILNASTLNLERVWVFNNLANGNGGGIWSEGPLWMQDTAVEGNSANPGGGSGGGLYHSSTQNLSITDATFNENSAQFGGGMEIFSSNASLTNVTISGNTAQAFGGLYNHGTCTVVNATIVDNTLTGGGLTGGVYNFGSIQFLNTILANNTGNNCTNAGISWVSNGYNIDSGISCQPFAAPGDQFNIVPFHLLLANNGGYTQTHEIPAGSPAIDKGTNAGCPSTDQRGKTRPSDGDGDGTATCDVGAYERVLLSSTTTITSDTPDPSLPGESVAVSVTVSGSGATPTGTVKITGASTNCNITLSGGSGSCNVVWNSSGSKTIKAKYLGDANYKPSSDTEPHTVRTILTKTYKSAGANDGWILESTETSGTGGTMDKTANTFYLGDDGQDRQYRAILHFATSTLPDNAVLTSVELKIKK